MRPRRRPTKTWVPRRRCAGCSTASPHRQSSATVGWTCSPSITSAGPCTPPVYDNSPGDPPNFARYTFLDEDSRRVYPDWDTAADTAVAILRTEAGRDPHDKALHDLVGELSTRSEEFRCRWGRHDVRLHGAGTKYFHHTLVGDLELAYESVDMISDPGLTLTIYAAEPASPTAEALSLLASWTALTPSYTPHPNADPAGKRCEATATYYCDSQARALSVMSVPTRPARGTAR